MGKIALLREQGWGVLPIYFGRQQQQERGSPPLALIDPNVKVATQQGKDDANDACKLAGNAPLEAGARVFLDIESSVALTKNTLAYISAWMAGVQQGGYHPALYCPVGVADKLHAAHPDVPIWVARQPHAYLDQASVIDNNGDVLPIPFDIPPGDHTPNWGFIHYAQTWQFFQNWGDPKNNPGSALRLYHDTGKRHDWNTPGLDINVSKVYDPLGGKNGPKGSQRRVVVSVVLDHANVKSGQQTLAHVNLSKPAPQPDGTVVLFRSSAAEAIVTGWSRVPVGAQSVAFPIHTVPTQQQIAVTLAARVLHQLDGAPVQVTLTLLPT
jgi:hypothetical protein